MTSEVKNVKCQRETSQKKSQNQENPELYKKYLEEDRSRKQKHRASLKETESPQELKEFQEKEATPYRSRQALGKALKRAHHSLPSSPRKKLFVVGKIVKSMGLDVSDSPTSSKCSSTITEETTSLVNDFYNNNDKSWQAPGRKDRVIIRAEKKSRE